MAVARTNYHDADQLAADLLTQPVKSTVDFGFDQAAAALLGVLSPTITGIFAQLPQSFEGTTGGYREYSAAGGATLLVDTEILLTLS